MRGVEEADNRRASGIRLLRASSEAQCRRVAAQIARAWRSQSPQRLIVGLDGPLGAGKTTWVRGMLCGLGHRGRVPSPTYTLLEYYELNGLTLVHLDLYRLPESEAAGAKGADGAFEALGVRDWLARRDTWVLVEWPGRAARLAARCDVWIEFAFVGGQQRALKLMSRSVQGHELLQSLPSNPSLDSRFKS